MKSFSAFSLSLFVSIFAPIAPSQTVVNDSFEIGVLTPWVVSVEDAANGWSIPTFGAADNPPDGALTARCMQITPVGQDHYIYQSITGIQAGEKWRMTGWVRGGPLVGDAYIGWYNISNPSDPAPLAEEYADHPDGDTAFYLHGVDHTFSVSDLTGGVAIGYRWDDGYTYDSDYLAYVDFFTISEQPADTPPPSTPLSHVGDWMIYR